MATEKSLHGYLIGVELNEGVDPAKITKDIFDLINCLSKDDVGTIDVEYLGEVEMSEPVVEGEVEVV